ncbi:hypothetical protein Y1Q_0017823 [Alligator mississippiensis]|uniref:Secreted protein n=1 Tax=Alligator mississippiensis TaxID=8496 RepID=A0A151MJP5_ALLMI|nr:hypothetical protein Y1Q_0017823 [Alligator mississippiensis]
MCHMQRLHGPIVTLMLQLASPILGYGNRDDQQVASWHLILEIKPGNQDHRQGQEPETGSRLEQGVRYSSGLLKGFKVNGKRVSDIREERCITLLDCVCVHSCRDWQHKSKICGWLEAGRPALWNSFWTNFKMGCCGCLQETG